MQFRLNLRRCLSVALQAALDAYHATVLEGTGRCPLFHLIPVLQCLFFSGQLVACCLNKAAECTDDHRWAVGSMAAASCLVGNAVTGLAWWNGELVTPGATS